MKKMVLVFLCLGIIIGGLIWFFLSGRDKEDNIEVADFKTISMSDARELLSEDGDYIILDVRRNDEYSEGHIPGAINVPNESIIDQDIPELPDKNQLIYVYCRSGNRSKQAAAKMVKIGYTNVIEFGGIIDWTGEIER